SISPIVSTRSAVLVFFFHPSSLPNIFTLSLHDALPISTMQVPVMERPSSIPEEFDDHARLMMDLIVIAYQTDMTRVVSCMIVKLDRKSTRLNSSHLGISYAVFCLKKKKLLPCLSPHLLL